MIFPLFAAFFLTIFMSFFSSDSLRAQDTSQTPQSGQTVAFLGDSITQYGAESPAGYVRLVEAAFKQIGQPIKIVPAGISGNTSQDMLGRLKRDVLDKKPDWMTLSCGVNDVWHGPSGVPLDQYKTNITSIVDQATAAGIKVVILTSTMIFEDAPNDLNKKLDTYNDFLRDLAKEKNLPVADLNADMKAEVARIREQLHIPNPGNLLTVDGVHMNGLGNEMMAKGVLKAFGFTEAQLTDVQNAWMELPSAVNLLPGKPAGLSVKDYLHLRDVAAAKGLSVDQMLTEDWQKLVQSQLAEPTP